MLRVVGRGCEALPVEVGHDAHAVLVVAVLGPQVACLYGLPHVVMEERQEARPAHQRFLLEDDNDDNNHDDATINSHQSLMIMVSG